ncbi:AGE family epimerase/isomerase [Actinoallomurus iriomotensis]|uniref:N-acylglucosamine 2-epimerase n=1 Tax=Actinoallomurus iriomotensis TaxID=478107 RepID=A0A9W6RWK3_9ACTN|nr:AGE family epimerase/isomerase [Actinoallomurus iriomotensis]GLY83295.1 N-acylglucosamine 2-epimerase [Actinoallomurus iriomotensis]
MRDARRYREHLENDVLAWWLAHGPDRELGGVHTCFANSGDTLVSTDKYTWSQGRWAWLLARLSRAARCGTVALDADDLLAQAAATGEFVAEHALLGDGTTAYVTAEDGTVRPYGPDGDPHASVFADLFAALGFAGLALADGAAAARWGGLAEELLVSAHERIAAGTARTEPYPVDPRFRGLAEPMMLMHVAAELHAATGSRHGGRIALAAVRTALTGGFVDGTDVRDLALRRPGLESSLLARHRTPGHLLEFAWFLTWAADQVPSVADVLPDSGWPARTALAALDLGWDRRDGGLLRYVDVEGGAPRGDLLGDPYEDLVVRTWDTKLWWPHAEALYATALLAERHDDERLGEWHDRVRDYTFRTFPEGPGREWTQIRARDGTPLDEVVALPVKDPFHIARALLLLAELGENTNSDARHHL